MAEKHEEELHRLRSGVVGADATIAQTSDGESPSFVEADLLYHDLSGGQSPQAAAELLAAARGQVHSAESWTARVPASAGKGIGDYLDHLREDLKLELWELPSPSGSAAGTATRTVAKNARERIPGGSAPVHHVPVYTTAPVAFGPFGAPTPIAFGGIGVPGPVAFGGMGAPGPVAFGGAGAPQDASASVGPASGADKANNGCRVQLAVLDTGLPNNYAELHPRLRDAVAPNPDAEDPKDSDGHLRLDAGHGLFILDVACGLAPCLKPVMMRRPTRNNSNLTLGDHLIALDLWEVARKAMSTPSRLIVNMSFATQTADDLGGVGLLRELTWLANEGTDVLVVAAAGNAGDDRKMFPAAFDLPNVVSVGALDPAGHVALFSGRGPWVDCYTTGVSITAGYLSGVYDHPRGYKTTFPSIEPSAQWSGTSFAAPRVAAAIARKAAEMPGASLLAAWETLRKQNRERHPHWSDASGRFFTESGVVLDI